MKKTVLVGGALLLVLLMVGFVVVPYLPVAMEDLVGQEVTSNGVGDWVLQSATRTFYANEPMQLETWVQQSADPQGISRALIVKSGDRYWLLEPERVQFAYFILGQVQLGGRSDHAHLSS